MGTFRVSIRVEFGKTFLSRILGEILDINRRHFWECSDKPGLGQKPGGEGAKYQGEEDRGENYMVPGGVQLGDSVTTD